MTLQQLLNQIDQSSEMAGGLNDDTIVIPIVDVEIAIRTAYLAGLEEAKECVGEAKTPKHYEDAISQRLENGLVDIQNEYRSQVLSALEAKCEEVKVSPNTTTV